MTPEDRNKSPSATLVEIPQTMLAQAAAAAQGNADDDIPLGRESTRQFLASAATEDDEQVPPPAYGDKYGDVHSSVTGIGTQASLTTDGRINVNINQTTNRLSSLLVPALRSQLDLVDATEAPPPYIPASLGGEDGQPPPPPLNVVIHVVGSRGDVQPFVALGKVLKEKYGHRVRLATHPVFRDFVTENGLDFFSIGGDPAELMAFMVKNPGLMPGFDTLRSGDIGKRRQEISTMIKGCWRSCIESGDGTGVAADDKTSETWMNNVDATEKPFIADAIIANPPSFAHIHCAEKLGVPLHIMFTMPYSPTQAFPHPLANIQSTNADPNVTNFITYAMVDMLTWQGLGDVINRLRVKQLNLDPINLIWAPGMLQRLRIPHTYCWSPALIPKPKDWGNQISISGFYFLSLASNFTPDPDLKAFLDAGPPPVYIGFGSIVVDDPNAMTKLIFDAVTKTGQRALVSKGWGGIGADQLGIPDGVFMLGNVPHDWLFKRVSCVVHHGGAGTTAAGIACGKPTVIVPFFGDQPFWGAMVAKAGAGPEPIPYKDLTADTLAESIDMALQPASKERAQELSDSINHEKGTETGARSFHQFLEVDDLRCSIAPSKAAVWRLKRTDVRLSALAATVLAQEGLLDFKDLKLYRSRDYEADEGPPDPFSGGGGALVGTISSMMMGVADFPVAALKALRIHPDSVPKKPTESQDVASTSTSEQQSTQQSSSTRSMSSEAPTPAPGGTFNLDESLAKMGSPHLSHQNTPEQGTKRSRSSSLAAALRGQFDERIRHRSGSSSSSNSRSASQQGGERAPKDKAQPGDGNLQEMIDAAFGTGKGVSRIVGAGFKSPMDFTHALAKGFHNAPKLYGDESVRKPDRVTDFKSGLRAATKEFGFGMYDGITGLVTQPLAGAKKEGAAGFVKGIGKGIGGIMLKPGAAVFGIPAYTMKGVYKELQALSGSSVQNYIIAARTAQGYDEWHRSNPQERQDMIMRWRTLQNDLKKKKFAHEHVQEAFKKQWQNAHSKSGGKAVESDAESSMRGHSRTTTLDSKDAPNAPPAYSDLDFTQTATPAELEQAIRASVADTSRGDPVQDEMIERAIRASVAELSSRPPQQNKGDDDNDYERAVAASMNEIKKSRGDDLNDAELEKALKASLEQKGMHSNEEEENDDEIRRAMKASQEQYALHSKHGHQDDGDEELQNAIRKSEQMHSSKSKEEEEERIVLEYVMKQSLREEELRKKGIGKGKGKEEAVDEVNEEDDGELRRAMEMSLRGDGKVGGRA